MKTAYVFKQLAGILLFYAVIFISAGRINYYQGLTCVAIGLLMFMIHYTVLKPDKDLLEERSKPGVDSKKWDKNILIVTGLVTLSVNIIAGLDSGRYHWSPEFPRSLFILGILFTASGQLIFMIAQKQNKFFSSTIRIQTERGHVVCDTGLYRIVRHPAYLSSVIQAIGFPMLFCSLWTIIPATALIILLITRTYLEDKTLQQELGGYRKYSEKTRYRLFPYLW